MTLMEPIFAASPFFLSASSHEISVIRMPFLCLRLLWRDGAASPTGQLQPEAQRQPPQLHQVAVLQRPRGQAELLVVQERACGAALVIEPVDARGVAPDTGVEP